MLGFFVLLGLVASVVGLGVSCVPGWEVVVVTSPFLTRLVPKPLNLENDFIARRNPPTTPKLLVETTT